MIHYWKRSDDLIEGVLIPKFYDPSIEIDLSVLAESHNIFKISELVEIGAVSVSSGDELGKASYGTGEIPFVRTSDISNWEIKASPKQGVSEAIYSEYAHKQDVQVSDILFVRDGTYLIGANCFVTEADREILYQSHVLKIRVNDASAIDPFALFLALNSEIVKKQIKSYQFTADTIDTLGRRFFDIRIALPKGLDRVREFAVSAEDALRERMFGKVFVKHLPTLLEESLLSGNEEKFEEFSSLSLADQISLGKNDAVSSEFGGFSAAWRRSDSLVNDILLPKYYDQSIESEISLLSKRCDLVTIGELARSGRVSFATGDEIGKAAYGTGTIPFLRTSDFSNWEIKHDPKQGVSQAIYDLYCSDQDVKAGDILVVRDGTYLVGQSCMVTSADEKCLFCGGLIKLRVLDQTIGNYLFLGLLNSFIVKRQMRAKQFTRDVIDTLGTRFEEVVIPLPRSVELRAAVGSRVEEVINGRVRARQELARLSRDISKPLSAD